MPYLPRNDKVLVIIGPSGAGKSSVVKVLHDRGIIQVTPSWTTRPPRADERHGAIEHHFVSEAVFTKKSATSYFLESAQLFGLSYWYGLPKLEKPANHRVPTVMLRANLLPLMDKHYANCVVYQIEDDPQKIQDRLQQRKTDGHKLGSRLQDYQKEIAAGRSRADRVFTNDDSLEALAERIILALSEDGLIDAAAP